MQEEKNQLDQDITIQEMGVGLKSMKPRKTPGCDGLPTEFYKIFWNLLKCPLSDAYIFAKKNGRLHISARRGIITLISKKERNARMLKNWCPLIMLNVDYKILAKLLSNQLEIVLDNLIGPQQTGYMQGRFTDVNIHKWLVY